VKRLDQVLDVGPKYAEQFERNGIRTVKDLARSGNLPDLSFRTGIPLELIKEWHGLALRKVKALRYRHRIAVLIAVIVAVALGWEIRALFQSPSMFSQGNAFYDRGKYAQALERYNKAIELNPSSEAAYANKGSALRMLRRYPEALMALDKAIALNPDDVWAYDERGSVYSNEGKYDQAIVAYDEALERDPKYKFAYAKAFALRKLGRYKEALDALNRAINVDPQWAWPYEERASIYHEDLFQYELAYQDEKKVSELKDGNTVEAELAEAALTSDRLQEAYDLASKLLARNENTDTNTFDVSDRCAARFVAISALLLQGNTARAQLKLEEFVKYYKSAAPGLERHWDYSGTQHFVASRPMDGASKRIILDLIKLLQPLPQITRQDAF
jgi:tetratricopeptide (TPR) repeat protein